MCLDTVRFIDIMGENFDVIKRNFQIGLLKSGYEFDEDLFIDVYIKCSLTLNERNLNKQDAIKYFRAAYINSLKRIKSKQIFISSLDELLETEEIGEGIHEEEYNPYTDKIYDFIIESVKDRFGENVMNAWKSHICENKSYKELAKDYGDLKFNFEFKRIKKYILNNLAKNDKVFIELMSCLRD